MALGAQTRLLLDFGDLVNDLKYLSDSSDLEIDGGCPMRELLSGHRQSCFSIQYSGRLYGAIDILDIASGCVYQHA